LKPASHPDGHGHPRRASSELSINRSADAPEREIPSAPPAKVDACLPDARRTPSCSKLVFHSVAFTFTEALIAHELTNAAEHHTRSGGFILGGTATAQLIPAVTDEAEGGPRLFAGAAEKTAAEVNAVHRVTFHVELNDLLDRMELRVRDVRQVVTDSGAW
jgi:hypothetical protein